MEQKRAAIADGALVRIHYSLSSDGRQLDRTDADEPLAYVHGTGQLVPGLEAALQGRTAGDEFTVKVPPSKGYGEIAPGGPQPIPRSWFPVEMDLYPGAMFMGEGRDGDHLPLWVTGIDGDRVLVSANHPYAGRELVFAVTIVDVEVKHAGHD